jgi:hypothetical protein
MNAAPGACFSDGRETNSVRQGRVLPLQPQAEAYGQRAAPAADQREIHRQHNQAERQHPESEDRQKSEETAEDQNHAEDEAEDGMTRNGNTAAEEVHTMHGALYGGWRSEITALNRALWTPRQVSSSFAVFWRALAQVLCWQW